MAFNIMFQTYGIRHRKEGEVELITYVDMVDLDGPAFKGVTIISIISSLIYILMSNR